MQCSRFGLICNRSALLKTWVFLCMLFSSVQPQSTDDGNISPCELESIINQLTNPSPEYQLHVSALRSQLKNLIRSSQTPTTNQLNADDYDFVEDDKRSIASLASVGQGYLNRPFAYVPKRSLATLAKNGQLPTPEPEEVDQTSTQWEQKRNLGSLARSGGMRYNGKRNIGTLARDFQLPTTGKRNLATLARLGLLTPGNMANNPKRNIAALARYNSGFRGAEKRNIGALKGSPVHGSHQKKNTMDEEALADIIQRDILDYAEQSNGLYPIYDDYPEMEKRFLAAESSQLESIDSKDDEQIDELPSSVRDGGDGDGDSDNDEKDDDVDGEDEDEEEEEEENDDEIEEEVENDEQDKVKNKVSADTIMLPISQEKRHIGALARSGWLPAGLRSVRSRRFSRSGRARQIVEFYPRPEQLRQPTAAVCRRCYLPYKPMVSWGGHGLQTTTWGTPPRITAQYRRSFRRPTTYRF